MYNNYGYLEPILRDYSKEYVLDTGLYLGWAAYIRNGCVLVSVVGLHLGGVIRVRRDGTKLDDYLTLYCVHNIRT